MDNQQPNTRVSLVFEETLNEEEGLTFLNVFVEGNGRPIDVNLITKGEPTLSEQWGYEMLGFVEDYLRMKINGGDMKGHLLVMPKKKDMN